jgi:hypothetical protein
VDRGEIPLSLILKIINMSEKKDIIQSFVKLGCRNVSNNGFHLHVINSWLRDVLRIHIIIAPRFEISAVSYAVQVLKYEPAYDNFNCIDDNMSSAIFGDNFDFLTYDAALEFGIWTAHDLIIKKRI